MKHYILIAQDAKFWVFQQFKKDVISTGEFKMTTNQFHQTVNNRFLKRIDQFIWSR